MDSDQILGAMTAADDGDGGDNIEHEPEVPPVVGPARY